MYDSEQWTKEDVDGRGRTITNYSGATKENHGTPESG
jgi:hypothetical protein